MEKRVGKEEESREREREKEKWKRVVWFCFLIFDVRKIVSHE